MIIFPSRYKILPITVKIYLKVRVNILRYCLILLDFLLYPNSLSLFLHKLLHSECSYFLVCISTKLFIRLNQIIINSMLYFNSGGIRHWLKVCLVAQYQKRVSITPVVLLNCHLLTILDSVSHYRQLNIKFLLT